MSSIGNPERAIQDRIIARFRDELGYRYLGDWTDRQNNSNIEEGLLNHILRGRGGPRNSARQVESKATAESRWASRIFWQWVNNN